MAMKLLIVLTLIVVCNSEVLLERLKHIAKRDVLLPFVGGCPTYTSGICPLPQQVIAVNRRIIQSQPVCVQPQCIKVQPQLVQVQPQPVYVQPQPVQVQPQPVCVQPQCVQVQPQPVQVQPQPVYVQFPFQQQAAQYYGSGCASCISRTYAPTCYQTCAVLNTQCIVSCSPQCQSSCA